MNISFNTKYSPNDVVYYMGIDGPIKGRIWYIQSRTSTRDSSLTYCLQTYPIKNTILVYACEDELFLTKKECKEQWKKRFD